MQIGLRSSIILENTLNKNKKKMNKNAAHLAMGERFSSAGEDASSLAISEKMRVRIRALEQDIRNTQNGSNLLSTAEEALHLHGELLTRMKEIAVESANGIYSDADRKILDQEFQQCRDQIDDIASMTNFNGIPLLDGTWGGGKKSAAPGSPGITVTEPTGNAPSTSVGGKVTITGDGIFTIPAGFTGTIEVKAKNVLINQANPAQLTDVNIVCDAGTNLTIEDLNISNTSSDVSIIDFRGSGNVLNLKGTNDLQRARTSFFYKTAAIHAGAGTELTICSTSNGGLSMENRGLFDSGALIGGSGEEDCGKLTIASGNISLHVSGYGAGIGGGGLKDDLTLTSSSNTATRRAGNCGEILIVGGNIDVTGVNLIAASIGGGGQTSQYYGPNRPAEFYTNGGKITIAGGVVNASTDSDGTAIGGGRADENIEINITGGQVHAVTDGLGAAIGGGLQGHDGTINISGGSVVAENNQLASGALASAIGAGWLGANYISNITGGSIDNNGVQQGNGNPGNAAVGGQEIDDKGLHIQTGTRSNQYVNVIIEDMHCAAIGLGKSDVLTRSTAEALLAGDPGPLDAALEKVLGKVTYLGAINLRLEHTEQTLVTDQENVVAAESVIRDTNMAKEMTEYTKNNILSQAAQAMLVQANQTAGRVTELLK